MHVGGRPHTHRHKSLAHLSKREDQQSNLIDKRVNDTIASVFQQIARLLLEEVTAHFTCVIPRYGEVEKKFCSIFWTHAVYFSALLLPGFFFKLFWFPQSEAHARSKSA